MAGVVVDAYRMHITKADWKELLAYLSSLVGKPLLELHTRIFYAGGGVWKGVPGDKRSAVTTAVFTWLAKRKHKVVYTAVDRARFHEARKAGRIPEHVDTPWQLMGLHLALALQKAGKRAGSNKGHTILVFDNHEREYARCEGELKDGSIEGAAFKGCRSRPSYRGLEEGLRTGGYPRGGFLLSPMGKR